MPGRGNPGSADRAARGMTGRFIVVEGPNGVGKTTVTAHFTASYDATACPF
jgi:KaiC/GvpD/RAD55 family RecA-like ATPase